jgi:hypothetical protein
MHRERLLRYTGLLRVLKIPEHHQIQHLELVNILGLASCARTQGLFDHPYIEEHKMLFDSDHQFQVKNLMGLASLFR